MMEGGPLTTPRLGRLWKDEYFQTTIVLLLIVTVVFGFWFGLRLALNTDYPMLAVASGSMSMAQPDGGWSLPFDRTLHTGDLIIVEGVSTSDIHPGPNPVGDILVFRESAQSDELIVHRAISETTIGGKTFFVTEGDGNAVLGLGPGPGSPTPAENVIGKVVLRIPWIGYLALFMRDQSGEYVILALIAIIIAIELIVSVVESGRTETDKNRVADAAPET
jgi:signal peptidase I